MIPVRDAAKLKGCTKVAVINAINQGKIDAEKFGNVWAIIENQKFQQWTPGEKHQAAGRARWSKPKKKRPA